MKELNRKTQTWDDKFGVIDKHCGFQTEDKKCGYNMPDSLKSCDELHCEFIDPMINIAIEGVGKDAEIVTNAAGGKQSKTPIAMHLVDPEFLKDIVYNAEREWEVEDNYRASLYHAIYLIGDFMRTDSKINLLLAMDSIEENECKQLIRIAKVLQVGADKYEPNNWRLIPQEEHINHALIHIMAYLMKDTQDNHLDHALCRLMMAYATEVSDGFDYCTFVDKRKAA